MDANAIRTADRRLLVECAAGVAANARDLLADAELLLEAGRWARAHFLAAMASEEWAKAYAVLTLSFMAPEVRARIDIREFLEGHRVKLMGAVLMCAVDAPRPGVAARVAAMSELASVLSSAVQQSAGANAAKQRGLYADLLAGGMLSKPSDVSEAEAAEAVARAREVGASAALLHDQDALAGWADPPAEALEVAGAVFGRLLGAEMDDADAAAALIADVAAGLASAEGPAA